MKKTRFCKDRSGLDEIRTSPQKSDSTLATVRKAEPVTSPLDPIRFSSWLRLKRVRAWINRFMNNCKQPRGKRTDGELTSEEINDSENQLIQLAQEIAFPEEIEAVRSGKELPKKIKLHPLKPWLDDDEPHKKFSGEGDIREFLRDFEIYVAVNEWSNEKAGQFLAVFLTDDAKAFYHQQQESVRKSYKELSGALKE
ncbi:Nucleotide-binding oligomerization domain-containing 2, partial [Paramuricea clavata]